MEKSSSMSKNSSTLASLGCFFHCSLVNFKNLIALCMVHEKVEEVLHLIWNIKQMICNLQSRIA